jgi:hypothetical protein
MTELPERLKHVAAHVGLDVGFIYAVGCHEYVKIGIAENVPLRIAGLQIGNPYDLVFLGAWKTFRPAEHELAIHRHLASYRVRGEWFKLPKMTMELLSKKPSAYDTAQCLIPPEKLELCRKDISSLNRTPNP